MRLLVAGADRVDAGKTTFSRGLLARLADGGAAPIGFKPRAGNDYWFDHDDVRTAVEAGRLYGKDVRLLAEESAGDPAPAPETLNPVHRLWRPTPGRSGVLGEVGRTFLVDRVSTPDGSRFVVNAGATVPERVRSALPLADARRVETVEALNEAVESLYLPAFDRLGKRVERTPVAVVESYGDVATPLRDVAYDAVAVVEPGRVRAYEGDQFARACEVARRSPRGGRMETRVRPVVETLDPLESVALPALSGDERADTTAVAAAYGDAYDALLASV